jgi:uncharacterized protein (DUF697 family)
MTNALHTIKRVLDAPEDQRTLLMEQSDAELSAFFSKPQNHGILNELAYSIVGMAWTDAMAEDITSKVIEVKTVGLNDRDYIEEDLRGMRAYWQGKGGDIMSYTLRHSREEMPRDEMVAALDIHDDDVANSFWGALNDLSSQYREKLTQLPLLRLIELLQAALPVGSTVDGESVSATFAAATLTDDNVDSVLTTIRKFAKGPISILGSSWAMHYLANVGLTFGDNVAQQVFNTGQVGQYKGAACVQVENFEDFDGNRVLPDNELWFVAQDAGRLTYYGNSPKVAVIRRPSFYQRWETARDAGMLLYGVQHGRLGRIVLT